MHDVQWPGPRRRLTLAPGALTTGPSLPLGSRFSALGETDEVDLAAEALAVEVASGALVEHRAVSREDVLRPVRSDADVAKEFWDYVGFPTRASRFWECGSQDNSEVDQGTCTPVLCRSQAAVATPESPGAGG